MNDERLISSCGTLRLLAESDGWRQKVELWLLNSKVNQNNWQYLNLEQHRALFAETPILVAYVGNKVGDGHNFTEIREPDGSVSASFMDATAERIVGYFKSADDIRLEEKDGVTWIVGTGYIWKWYARELVNKLKEQGLEGMSVSIETLIDEMHKDGRVEVFTKYQLLGTTILGDDVPPAVKDANIKVLSAIGSDEVRKMTLRVASRERDNPQKIKTEGVKENAMKITEVQAKLPNYRVLAVSGSAVLMLSQEGMPYMCNASLENGEIKIGEESAVEKLSVCCGDTSIEVDADKITADLVARCAKANADLEAERAARQAAEDSVSKMKATENARRCEAVKNAVKERLAHINATRDGEIEDGICADMLTDEAVAAYAEMEDADGTFIGDACASRDLDARCMNKILEDDARRNNAASKRFVWEGHRSSPADTSRGILGAAERLANRK